MSENTDIDRKRLIQFLADVDQEILNMRSGEGRWYGAALCFDKGPESSPVMHRLSVFKDYPTRKNLMEFFEISEQDFGKLTTDNFRTWGKAIFPPTTEEKKANAVRPFGIQFKDAFYDLFRTVNIAMTPKQTERIEVISLKLAKTFEQAISETVEAQLGALVKALKAKEAVPVAVPVAVTPSPAPSDLTEATEKVEPASKPEIGGQSGRGG